MCEPVTSQLVLSTGDAGSKDSTEAPPSTNLDMKFDPKKSQAENHGGICNRVASARSSGSSSAYYSSTSSCFDFQLASTPIPAFNLGTVTERRTRLSCEQDLSSIFAEDKEVDEDSVNKDGVQPPSLKMIRRLKRMSDAWSHVSKCLDNDDIIIDRLKKGREEAKRRQTYIEVNGAVSISFGCHSVV